MVPGGLHLHDLAREVLTAELHWRDADRQELFQRRAGAYYRRRLDAADPASREAALHDYSLLRASGEAMSRFVAPRTDPEQLAVQRATAAHWPVLRAALARFEGPESVRLAGYWYQRRPDAFHVVAGATGEVAGWFALLGLHDLEPDDRQADPAVAGVLSHLDGAAPLLAGEHAYLLRFWLAVDGYQTVTPAQTRIAFFVAQGYLADPAPAYTFQAHADPDFWAEASALTDMHRLPGADFVVDEHRYGVYGHDWRTVPPSAWLAAIAARQARPATAATATDRRLDRPAFTAELRKALPLLNQPDRLRTSPLLRTRLVLSRVDSDGGSVAPALALRQVIVAATTALASAPRDRRGARALHHTYVQPADTQAQAAELLRLPMSTYRRHLAAGITRLTEVLWQQELES